MANEYIKQAQDFLEKHNIKFEAMLIGSDCPRFCIDDQHGRFMELVDTYPRKFHIHGKHYRCTFTKQDAKTLTIEFWNSYADEEKNATVKSSRLKPTAYDVLTAIQKSDVGTFEEFCSEFGYDTDSRKALEVYNAAYREYRNVSRFFTAEELTEAQEIN